MRRFLLSFFAMVALVIGASAAVEPTYTATGNVVKLTDWETSYPSIFPEREGLKVEVYEEDSIVVRDWCGGDVDLVVHLDNDGLISSISELYNDGATPYAYKSGNYFWLDTGLDTPQGLYVLVDNDYNVYCESDAATKSGYVLLAGWGYTDEETSAWTYCYIEWSNCSYVTTGTVDKVAEYENDDEYPVATTFPTVKDVPVEVYGTDSVIVRSWCGVDGYDVCVTRDSEGNVNGLYRVIDGVSVRNGSGYYFNAETGLTAPQPALVQAYLQPGYGTLYTNDDDNSGYLELWGYTYDTTGFTNGVWTYYYLGWGSYEPTGINTPVTTFSDKNAPVYNLSGQKVGENYKGVVIQNGKKFIRK